MKKYDHKLVKKIHKQLAEFGAVAIIWSIEDVHSVANDIDIDINDEQAHRLLIYAKEKYGEISNNIIAELIDEYI